MEGVLQAMSGTKRKAGGLVGLALATLAVGAGAAPTYQEKQEGRVARSRKPPQPPDAGPPDAGPPDAARPTVVTAAPFVPLPSRDELHQLLRRASSEAVALAKAEPSSSSWCLTTIATAQAKAGDLDGARATFADAAKEAGGAFGGAAYPWNV